MPIDVISWNIQNLGKPKQDGVLKNSNRAAGVGNTVKDYIVKVLTRKTPFWAAPDVGHNPYFDLIVIIELKSGGANLGANATGAGPLALIDLVNAINDLYEIDNGNGPRPYRAITPLFIGNNQTVGVIYNSDKLAEVGGTSEALLDNQGDALLKATPFKVEFTRVGVVPVQRFRVVGVHGAPEDNGVEEPVAYCRQFPNVPGIATDPGGNFAGLLMGDFNCNIATINDAGEHPFTEIMAPNAPSYTTPMINGTAPYLTSMKKGAAKIGNYRNNAFDNIFSFGIPAAPAFTTSVIDLIDRDPRYNEFMNSRTFTAVIDNYWKISDHLPVQMSIP